MILLKLLGTFIILWTITICNAEEIATTLVETSLGEVKGIQMESRLGDKFWAFLSVPYGEPPVGDLRFQNPQPVKAWKPKVHDATKQGPVCTQSYVNTSTISEDCLHLNIFTKETNPEIPKPVIVYLSHGGFYFHGANNNRSGAEHFMDRDIVLVTFNFRLGTLGFLATGTADAPGNMGLKDQVMALRWVQQHIAKFGGDRQLVTLLGYGSGSWSIGLHMMSPMSKGLFHKGIMMSGSPLGQLKYETNQLKLAKKQARLLNCPESPIKEMVECLKTKPIVDFAKTTTQMFDVGWNPLFNWLPVIESNCEGNQERFLEDDPYTIMSKGNIYKVPLIMGLTEYEYYYMTYNGLKNASVRDYFNEDFSKYSPIFFLYERDTPKSQEASAAIRSFYFQNKSLEFPKSLESFGQLYADGISGFRYYRFLQMVSKHVSVYTYFNTFKARLSNFVDPDTKETKGAVTHDEILYLFKRKQPSDSELTDSDKIYIERLTRLFAEFAKKSDPKNCADDYIKSAKWPLYSEDKKEYLEIGQDFKVKSNGFYEERFQFWNKLFPINEMLNSNSGECSA
ncbi:carboxylic ester hydrolase-like [Cochliomyia hominivorax]